MDTIWCDAYTNMCVSQCFFLRSLISQLRGFSISVLNFGVNSTMRITAYGNGNCFRTMMLIRKAMPIAAILMQFELSPTLVGGIVLIILENCFYNSHGP
jgi:hypothetical protein